MSRRLAFLALLAAFLALPTAAADADYYKRTGTKPPLEVDGFVGPRFPVSEGGVGFGLHGGALFKQAGVLLTISADAVRLDGLSGSVTPPGRGDHVAWPRPQPAPLPWSTPDRTVGVFTIGVLFRMTGPN